MLGREGERMARIRELNWYQKAILLLMTVMTVVFCVLYGFSGAKTGFLYQDKVLVLSHENGNAVYSGKLHGQSACFLVTPEGVVTFTYGEKIYGPYTVREDPTAIPKDDELAQYMTGIEICCGGEILFRGGIMEYGSGSFLHMVSEDGTNASISVTATMSDGTVIDADGNIADEMEPSLSTVLELVRGPELTAKADWAGWFGGLLICGVTAALILFADELFRLGLVFRVQNVEDIEPSDWELASRYIPWTVLPIVALVLYLTGLR